MQIVIDIPEDRYNEIYSLKFVMHGLKSEENKQLFYRLVNAVRDGTPLPKGHGNLIDADVFEKRLMDARSYYVGEKADDFDLRFAAGLKSAAERLVDAPTIIEADKAESEDLR